jgi:hypothetical protein
MLKFLERSRQQSEEVQRYFIEAFKAYVLKNDKAAGRAAMCAGIMARGKSRDLLAQFAMLYANNGRIIIVTADEAELPRLAEHLVTGSPNPSREALNDALFTRTQKLLNAIANTDDSLRGRMENVSKLAHENPDYAQALKELKAPWDAGVFRRKYPDLPIGGHLPAPFLTDQNLAKLQDTAARIDAENRALHRALQTRDPELAAKMAQVLGLEASCPDIGHTPVDKASRRACHKEGLTILAGLLGFLGLLALPALIEAGVFSSDTLWLIVGAVFMGALIRAVFRGAVKAFKEGLHGK